MDASTPVSSCVGLTWPETAAALGIELRSRACPQQLPCPICKTGIVLILQDSERPACWHHCRGCGSRGDMAVLAAATWRVSLEVALERLGNPRPAAHARYAARVAGVRAAWARAAENLATGAYDRDTARLMRSARLGPTTDPGRIRDAQGRLYGVIHRRDFEEIAGLRRLRSSPLAGTRAGEFVWAPYFDLPGRICALGALRGPDPDDASYGAIPGITSREFGLAGLPAVEGADGMFDDQVLAMADPWLMLRWQNRHLATTARPLPLVSWREAGGRATRTAWRALGDRRVVLWAPRLDAATLRQAIITDGHLSLIGGEVLRPDVREKWISDASPVDHVNSILGRARPWRDAFERWAKRQADGVVGRLLRDLEISDSAGLLAYAPARIADLLARVVRAPTEREITLGDRRIREAPDGSWSVSSGRGKSPRWAPLCDAALRLDLLIAGPTERYRGRVRYRGEEVPFEAPRRVVDDDPLSFVDRVLIDARRGVLECDRRHARLILPASRAFCAPRVVGPEDA